MASKPARAESGKVMAPTAFEILCREMGFRAKVEDDGSANAAAVQQLEAILNAESEEDMWDADERAQIGGRDLVDVEMTIYGFSVKYGSGGADDDEDSVNSFFKDPETGKQMYVLVEAARTGRIPSSNKLALPEVGEKFVWNTSARLLVAKLFWLDRNAKIPVSAVIRDVKLPGKRAVLKLKPTGNPVTIQGSTEPVF